MAIKKVSTNPLSWLTEQDWFNLIDLRWAYHMGAINRLKYYERIEHIVSHRYNCYLASLNVDPAKSEIVRYDKDTQSVYWRTK